MNTQTLKANIKDDGLMQKVADLPKTVSHYPKDIIREMEAEVPELTTLEKDVLINGIAGSGFYNGIGSEVWSDCIVDTCKVATKMQISGVVASLVKKNLIETSYTGTSEAVVKFTPRGLRTLEQIELPIKEKVSKNPQDIVRMNAIDVCISVIHDIRFVEMPDDAKDLMLKNLRNELVAIYDSLKQSLEG